MLQPKKPSPKYAPYGSDKVDLDSKGFATPKVYPKTRTMGSNPKTGKSTITVTNNATKKMLFSKDDVDPKSKAKASNRFKSDSTDYSNNAKRQAEKINIGKVASDDSYKNAMAFAGKKKKTS